MKRWFLLLLCFSVSPGFAQDAGTGMQDTLHPIRGYSKGFGPVVGYRGFVGHFLEAGVTQAGGNHGIVGYEFTYLNNLRGGEDALSGLSVGGYRGFAIFEAGVNATIYTNFEQATFTIRPYFGLGIGGIATASYGFNLPIGRNHFWDQTTLHEIRVVVRLPFGML